ncbi:MAG: hypothetical protein K0U38_09030 [Epsilonproteobacteria bacterium]|nr:hypothetical protein [Campylobacterota bacterium]
MQTIQIENDLYRDILKYGIDIQAELKRVINKFSEQKEAHSYLDSQEFQLDKAYFQNCLDDIESGKTKLLNQETYNRDMDSFVEELKAKYGNS